MYKLLERHSVESRFASTLMNRLAARPRNQKQRNAVVAHGPVKQLQGNLLYVDCLVHFRYALHIQHCCRYECPQLKRGAAFAEEEGPG